MAQSTVGANESLIQFLHGFDIYDEVGLYKAPATAQDEGTFVKMSDDGETLEVASDNDAQFILTQPCALVSPIGNAANREKWMNNIPQKAVECGTEITVVPVKSGGIIRTKKVALASDTGAMLAASITPGTTQWSVYAGVPRITQGGDTVIGIILTDPDSNDYVDLLIN